MNLTVFLKYLEKLNALMQVVEETEGLPGKERKERVMKVYLAMLTELPPEELASVPALLRDGGFIGFLIDLTIEIGNFAEGRESPLVNIARGWLKF